MEDEKRAETKEKAEEEFEAKEKVSEQKLESMITIKEQFIKSKEFFRGSELFGQGYNCLTWCEEKLRAIGENPDEPIAFEIFANWPENHLPDKEAKESSESSCTIF